MRSAMIEHGVERAWATSRMTNDSCAPMLTDSMIVYPTDDQSTNEAFDGAMQARDRATGTMLWSRQDSDRACPVLHNGLLAFEKFITAAETPAQLERGIRGQTRYELSVLDATSGKEACHVEMEQIVSLAMTEHAIGVVTQVGTGSGAKSTVAVFDTHCKQLWSRPAERSAQFLVPTGGLFLNEDSFFGDNFDTVSSLDEQSATPHWQHKSNEHVFAGDLRDADDLILRAGALGSKFSLQVVDVRTGAPVGEPTPTGESLRYLPNRHAYWDGHDTFIDPFAHTTTKYLPLELYGVYASEMSEYFSTSNHFTMWGVLNDQVIAVNQDRYLIAEDGIYTSDGKFVPSHTVTVTPWHDASSYGATIHTEAPSLEFGNGGVDLVDAHEDAICSANAPTGATSSNHELRIVFQPNARDPRRSDCKNDPRTAMGPFHLYFTAARGYDHVSSLSQWYGTAKSAPFAW